MLSNLFLQIESLDVFAEGRQDSSDYQGFRRLMACTARFFPFPVAFTGNDYMCGHEQTFGNSILLYHEGCREYVCVCMCIYVCLQGSERGKNVRIKEEQHDCSHSGYFNYEIRSRQEVS